jgi:hypothetical protein
MVQFFIAYWFLHRYIFAPAYAIMHKEDIAIHKLEDKITVLQHSMIEQEAQNQKGWRKIQKKLLTTVSKQVKPAEDPVSLDDVDLHNSICELQDEEVAKGQNFLQEHILKIDEVEK